MNLTEKKDTEIHQWIKNYEKNKVTDDDFYRLLVEERSRRAQEGSSLNFEITLALLRQAAMEQTCTTYGDVAAASKVPWTQAHRQFSGAGGHLDQLLDLCHARGLPLLTALCVNKEGRSTCELSEDSLRGFSAGARRLGYSVEDERAFHHQCRDESWAWGRQQGAEAR